jgi:hypothetical protein
VSETDDQLGQAGEQPSRVPPAAPTFIAPVPRIALTQQEACASLGCSEEFFVEHVRPHLRVVRRGRKRLFPVDELRRVVDMLAEKAI